MAGLDKDGLEYFGEQAAHSGLLPENFWSGCLHVTRGRRDLISSFYSEIRLGPRVAHADLLYSLKSNSFASWLQAMHADGETGPSRRLLELILAKYNQTTSLWFEHDNVAQATMAHRQPSRSLEPRPIDARRDRI